MSSALAHYREAVEAIKTAILQSQYEAAKATNAKQLQLYFSVGGYISAHVAAGEWGDGAVEAISGQLQKELPGLRGFSARNMYYMRTFFDEWSTVFCDWFGADDFSALASAEKGDGADGAFLHSQVQKSDSFPLDVFLSIGFTHHREILSSAKSLDERLFYIRKCAEGHLSVEALKRSLKADDYHHQGKASNNFLQTIPDSQRALRAINTFKDEYLLDFINVEELGVRDVEDVDERVLEQGIVHNVKSFIMTFGRAFSFVGNQYRLDAFGQDQYIDLLFFNRDLNCLVAVELKAGPFKTAYLGQLSGYLSILDGFERKPHENAPIGLILCKDMNRSFVDYVVQDYTHPMGVATYKTSQDMPSELLDALPPIDELKALLDGSESEGDA